MLSSKLSNETLLTLYGTVSFSFGSWSMLTTGQ